MCLSLTVTAEHSEVTSSCLKARLKWNRKWNSAREGQHVGAPSPEQSLQPAVNCVHISLCFFFHVGRAASQNNRYTELEIREDGRGPELQCLPWAAALQNQQRKKKIRLYILQKNAQIHNTHCAVAWVGESRLKEGILRIRSLSSVFRTESVAAGWTLSGSRQEIWQIQR